MNDLKLVNIPIRYNAPKEVIILIALVIMRVKLFIASQKITIYRIITRLRLVKG